VKNDKVDRYDRPTQGAGYSFEMSFAFHIAAGLMLAGMEYHSTNFNEEKYNHCLSTTKLQKEYSTQGHKANTKITK